MAPADFPAGGYVRDYLVFWAVWLVVVAATVLFFRRKRTAGAPGRGRLVAGNLLVAASLFATAVLAAETYLRYVYDATDSLGLMLTNFSWFRRHVHFNANGFRDREFVREKPAGVTRIACFGDSFTMGWGVKDPEDCYPQRLRAALDARSPGRYEVRNLGVVGLTTGQESEVIDQAAPVYALDRAILGYCLNDADDLLPPDRWLDTASLPRVPWMKPTRSFLADFLWFRLRLYSDPRVRDYFETEKEAYADPSVWRAQCARFAHIADTCRGAAIPLDVVVFPVFSDWGPDYGFNACHDRVAAAWQALGVRVIDLREAYRGIPGANLVASRYDSHPNARAHDIAARAILERAFPVRR